MAVFSMPWVAQAFVARMLYYQTSHSCMLVLRFCHKGIFCICVLNLSYKAVRFVRETCYFKCSICFLPAFLKKVDALFHKSVLR